MHVLSTWSTELPLILDELTDTDSKKCLVWTLSTLILEHNSWFLNVCMWTGAAVPYKIERNISIGFCEMFIAQWTRIHFNSSSEAVFRRLTAIGKDFKLVSNCPTFKSSFLLVHIISGRWIIQLLHLLYLINLPILLSCASS